MEGDPGKMETIEGRLAALEAAVGRLVARVSSSPEALGYPEPLATPLAQESGARLHHERIFSLLDAGQACVEYTAAMVIALCRAGGRNFDIEHEYRQPLSFGDLAALIREMLASPEYPDYPIARALKSSLLRANGRLTPPGRYLLEEFIAARNRERGYASSLPDQAYEALYLRHATPLHDALGSFGHLTYPLVKIESVDVVTEPFSYDVRLLVGPPSFTSTERIQAHSRVSPGTTCVWDRDGMLLDLLDLVVYRSCPTCNLEHTFFLERCSERTKLYHAYLGNHRFDVRTPTRGS